MTTVRPRSPVSPRRAPAAPEAPRPARPEVPAGPRPAADAESTREAGQALARLHGEKPTATPVATESKSSVPLGAWSFDPPTAAHAKAAVKAHRAAFQAIRDSGVPGREVLIQEAIRRRAASPHAYFRGSPDLRTADLARMMPPERYAGGAGRVLSTGDCHLFQPKTFLHETHGLVVGFVDTDRAGLGPYEWDLRSLLTSAALAGRELGMTPAQQARTLEKAVHAYRDAVESVAKEGKHGADDAAKALRMTAENAPAPLRKLIDTARARDPAEWREKMLDGGGASLRLRRRDNKVLDIPGVPAGARERITAGIKKALPGYLAQLPKELQEQYADYKLVDVSIPVSGNGSMGYGRFQALLVPPGKHPDAKDALVLEFKEEFPPVVPGQPKEHAASEGQRVVDLFRLGQGAKASPFWGSATLPAEAGVKSRSFFVSDVRADEEGVDLQGTTPAQLTEMLVAQARMLAGQQCLAGIHGDKQGVGGARDIAQDMAARPRFQDENVQGALQYAAQVERDAQEFSKAFAQPAA